MATRTKAQAPAAAAPTADYSPEHTERWPITGAEASVLRAAGHKARLLHRPRTVPDGVTGEQASALWLAGWERADGWMAAPFDAQQWIRDHYEAFAPRICSRVLSGEHTGRGWLRPQLPITRDEHGVVSGTVTCDDCDGRWPFSWVFGDGVFIGELPVEDAGDTEQFQAGVEQAITDANRLKAEREAAAKAGDSRRDPSAPAWLPTGVRLTGQLGEWTEHMDGPGEIRAEGEPLWVALRAIATSPLNPRKQFDQAELEELASSIRQHGILEPLVVRPSGATVPAYVLVAGERRWRAAHLAGLSHAPVVVRADIDERAHLQIALIENLQRVNLDPMEEADAYRRLNKDVGLSQTEIAKAVNRGQPAIAKAMSLLKLPEDVQQLVRQGKLTASHGVVLAQRFDGFPLFQSAAAVRAAAAGWTTHFLEGKALYEDYDLQKALGAAGMRRLGWEARFNTQVCKECPFNAHRASSYGAGVCLKPEHFDELQREAAERDRAALEARVKAVDLDVPPWATEGLSEEEQRAHRERIEAERAKRDEEWRKGQQEQREAHERATAEAKARAAVVLERTRERLAAPEVLGQRELAVLAVLAVSDVDADALAEAVNRYAPALVDLPARIESRSDYEAGHYLALFGQLDPATLVRVAVDALMQHAAASLARQTSYYETPRMVAEWLLDGTLPAAPVDEEEVNEQDESVSGTVFPAGSHPARVEGTAVREVLVAHGAYSKAVDAAREGEPGETLDEWDEQLRQRCHAWGRRLAELNELAGSDNEAALQLAELQLEIEAEGHDADTILEQYEDGAYEPDAPSVPVVVPVGVPGAAGLVGVLA